MKLNQVFTEFGGIKPTEIKMKLSQIIKEAQEEIGKDVESALKKIEKFSNENKVTESLLELAKLLKSKKHETILKAMMDIHGVEESMPYMLEKYREEIGRELSMMSREKLNNKEFAAIYTAL